MHHLSARHLPSLITLHSRPTRLRPRPKFRIMASSAVVAPSRIISSSEASSILSSVDALVVDCDGVLWRGSELMPHTQQTLAYFRSQGKRLLFVTNNASKSRRQYVSKFQSLGLQVDFSEIISASFLAAAFLQSIRFPSDKKVLLISSSGVDDELSQAGIEFEHVEGAASLSVDELKALTLNPDIGAVVVGHDESFSYRKICVATAYLRERPDVLFIGTNPDNADNLGGGRFMPGTGCLLAAIESAAQRKATIVGKGGDFLVPFLLETCGLVPARTLVIGDRLDTDILLGKQAGAWTGLPLTGVNGVRDVERAEPEARPDFIFESLSVLAGFD